MRRALAGLMFFGLLVGSQPLMAAEAAVSECKGLEQSVCASKQRCSWVKAYKTIKGRDVAAFCRKKPDRKASAEAKAASGKVQ